MDFQNEEAFKRRYEMYQTARTLLRVQLLASNKVSLDLNLTP
jgi:hypothetical protein